MSSGANTPTKKCAEGGQKRRIFFVLVFQHDIINDQVVALGRHGDNSMTHPAQDPFADRPGPDGNQPLSVFGNFLKGESIGVILQGLGQHGAEVIHLDVQEWLDRNFLELFCDGALA